MVRVSLDVGQSSYKTLLSAPEIQRQQTMKQKEAKSMSDFPRMCLALKTIASSVTHRNITTCSRTPVTRTLKENEKHSVRARDSSYQDRLNMQFSMLIIDSY